MFIVMRWKRIGDKAHLTQDDKYTLCGINLDEAPPSENSTTDCEICVGVYRLTKTL
jgi:hypothetical protein